MPSAKSTKSPAFQFYAPKFWRNVNKTDTCWLWTAGKDKDGYGMFWAGRSVRAHRFSFLISFGWLLDSGVVMHTCDTPACVRPDHLVLGTHGDNVRDKILKGRLKVPHGAEHWSRRFSEEQIKAIRDRWKSGESQASMARQYGVGVATINRAVRQLCWEERNV